MRLYVEETAGVVAAEPPEFFGLHAAGGGHVAHGEHREGGLVALAAPGHGRKVGAVGLQQQAVVRDDGQGLAHGLVGRIADRAGDGRLRAVGEIGLDFYWSADFRAEQTEAFRRQIELALECGLPVAVHTRSAWPETAALVREYAGRGLRGVFHAFSDTLETYRTLRECGDFVFGIGGVVTFRKSALAEVVRGMELCDMVLETDCPYLTPVPYRGRRNEPAYVRFVCEKVAELKGLSPERVAAETAENARRLFGV